MSNIKSLVIRDTKIFYRTKGNIFFSFLSVLILVILHFMIFRDMNTNNWMFMMADVPGLDATRLDFQWIVDSLMFSALIPIGAVSIAMTTLSLIVEDREKNALTDFLVAPINRNSLMVSYLLSSFLVCFALLFGLLVFFQIFFFAIYGVVFTAAQIVYSLLVMVGAIIFGNIFMLLLISFIKTSQSLSAMGAIVGTLIGFVSGAYIPLGMYGETVSNIFSALPFAQLTVLLRGAFFMNLETATPMRFEMFTEQSLRAWGLTLWIGDTHIPVPTVAVFCAVTSLVLLVLLMVRFRRMKKPD